MKRCCKCKQIKKDSEFSTRKLYECIPCRKIKKFRCKVELLSAYSNGKCICECCGEYRLEFLTLDHIGDSRKKLGHEKIKGRFNKGGCLHRRLRNEGYPHKDKLRVLCFNCNSILGFRGYCPHQEMYPLKPLASLYLQNARAF